MYKFLLSLAAVIAVLVGGFFILNAYIYNEKQAVAASDYKDAEYFIDGQRIQLKDGEAQSEAAPGSASKIVTKYFGNELKTDLNSDGREDVVFLLTQNTGGSGTFYYVVGALNTDRGYVGTDGYLLGDRVAPQTTEVSQNPSHKSVIVVNYADRAAGEPMTTPPSVGKSVYLKLDTASMMWGIVEPNFEGESRSGTKEPVISWKLQDAGERENIPYTTVSVTVNGTTHKVGSYQGSCAEIGATGGVDGKGLLAGELSAVQCWFAGGGDEIGVFANEDGGVELMVGSLEEGIEGGKSFRGNFKIREELKF